MNRILAKTVATVALTAAIGTTAATANAAPAGLPLQPADPAVSDTITSDTAGAGVDSGSALGRLLLVPVGISSLIVCGIWAGTTGPDPRPICQMFEQIGSASA